MNSSTKSTEFRNLSRIEACDVYFFIDLKIGYLIVIVYAIDIGIMD